jgi:hypothetical protein
MKWRFFEPTRKIFFLSSCIAAGSGRRYTCSLFMGALPVRQRFLTRKCDHHHQNTISLMMNIEILISFYYGTTQQIQ